MNKRIALLRVLAPGMGLDLRGGPHESRRNAERIRQSLRPLLRGRLGLPFLLFLLTTVFLAVGYGQTYTSNIVGTVTDTSGAVIPGANVTLVNVHTGVKEETKANGVGNYTFQYLQPGQFTLAVEATGFKKFVRENISLLMYSKLGINVTLEPGAVTQSVVVRAATPLLQTQTGEQSTIVTNQQVEQLPLSRGGYVIAALKLLSPGVVNSNQGWLVSEGGPLRMDQDYIDGALTTSNVWGGTAVTPAPDAIQEVKVMTNAFSAVYGNTGGAITVATTKSGTNQIHGDVYEYLENNAFNGGNEFTHKISKEVFNEPGFTVGGPIKKNKLFFFVDGQWVRNFGQSAFTGVTVPDISWRSGDFSNVLGGQAGTDALGRPIYKNEIFNYSTQRAVTAGQVDPVTGLVAAQTGYVREPYANNIIPAGDLNSSALALQKYYPDPTLPGAILQNYDAVQPSVFQQHQWVVKIDYDARPQDKIMGRWTSYISTNFGGYPFPGLGGGSYGAINESGQSPVLDWVHILGPSTTNDVHAAYYHIFDARYPVGYGQVGLSTFGITGLPNGNQKLGMPSIGGGNCNACTMAGSSGTAELGTPGGDLYVQGQADIFVDDVLTHIYGKHTIQVGGEVQRMQINSDQPIPLNAAFGFSNDFSNQYTGAGVTSTGFDYASFLLGLPDNVSYTAFPNDADVRASVYALFAEDAFRVKPNLTLDLGLRWDAPLYWTGANHTTGAVYTWNGTNATYRPLGGNGFRNTEWNNNWWNFGPRFGIAWSPSRLHNTVFRAGYGLFTMGAQINGAQGTVPLSPAWYSLYDNGIFSDGLTAALTESRGLTLNNIPYAPFVLSAFNPNATIVANNNPIPEAQQWNIGVQHEVGGVLFNVAYAGSHDYHLEQNHYSINPISPNLLSACQGKKFAPNGTQCVPYPQYNIGALGVATWLGENSYNSLQITATKHFSQGLSFMAGYTWAKNLNVGENGYRFPITDRYADRAWDLYSVPQRFTLAYIYALPFGRGNHWLTSGPLVPILGDWQVSGITTLQAGFPYHVSGANSCPGCGIASGQPNMISNPVPSGFTQNTTHWFDVSAFTEPALWTVGNEGFSTFFGPAMTDFDIGVSKRFYFPKLGESRNLQFRADFFNAFNTPWFSPPNTNLLQSTAAGTITSTQNSPRVIQVALKFNF